MNADEIQQFVEEFLTSMGVAYSNVTVDDSDTRLRVAITSDDSQFLIGGSGRHLAALNHVIGRAIRRRGLSAPLFIDVNEYHRQEAERLKEKAAVVAERVRSFQTTIEMEPMSSYERMIIHTTLHDEPNITTESAGDDRDRHVVVRYHNET